MKKESIETIGDRIKKSRLDKGMSNAELSKAINKHHSLISSYENGKRNPSLSNLLLIANCLDVDPMWLKYGFSFINKHVSDGIYTEAFFKNAFELEEAKNSKLSDDEKIDSMLKILESTIDKLKKKKDYASISAIFQFANILLNENPGIEIAKLLLIDKQQNRK